ncbi:magnesium transporter [Novosphingobium profundi]|nr:magnesium transporter [Novosphingobium profundi]
MLGVAGVAVVANAMALATPSEADGPPADGGRMGASLRQAADERDRAAAKERQKLDLREQALKASEARLADQARGAAAPTPGRTPAAGGAAEPDVPYDRLAAIYQRMKPAQAAPIFERLDLEVQAQVARRMRDQVTAQIMSKMSPDAAVKLSMSLAGRRVVEAAPRRSPEKKEAQRN